MTTVLEARSDWPWIAGRNELVRLVAGHDHEKLSFLREVAGSYAGIDVFADMQEGKGLSWAELLDATHRALETTGREIKNARTVEEVEAARLRHEIYERLRSENAETLLSVAHNLLKRHPTDGGWLVGYGRSTVGGEMEIISPTAWEAGTPDWDNWRLTVADGSTFFGVRLLYLEEADAEIWEEVVVGLDGGHINSSSNRAPRPVVPEYKLDAWYKKRVENWPPDKPSPNRDDDLEAAREEFGDRVIMAQIKAVRRENAPPQWTAKGRRKSGQN